MDIQKLYNNGNPTNMSHCSFENSSFESNTSIRVTDGDIEILEGCVIMADVKTGHKYKLMISDGKLCIEAIDKMVNIKQKIDKILENG